MNNFIPYKTEDRIILRAFNDPDDASASTYISERKLLTDKSGKL